MGPTGVSFVKIRQKLCLIFFFLAPTLLTHGARSCLWQAQTSSGKVIPSKEPCSNGLKTGIQKFIELYPLLFLRVTLIVSYGMWIVRNKSIFKDSSCTLVVTLANAVGIFAHYPQLKEGSTPHIIQDLSIDKTKRWGFIDFSTQANPSRCGGGVVLFLNKFQLIKRKKGLGEGSKKYVELLALKLLLQLAIEYGCRTLKIFGDYMTVINGAKGIQRCHIMRLLPILEEVQLFIQNFHSISISNVYREHNHLENTMSKESAKLQTGKTQTKVVSQVELDGFYHRPFHEDPMQEG